MLACAWGGGCSRLRQDAGQSRCPHAPERCGDAAHGLVVAVPVPACARWRIGGRDGRQFSGRCPHAPGVVGCEHLTSTRVNPGVAWAGVVGVAHSRAPRTGGNRGIMRNSTVSSGRSRAPMCIDPPHCTWEPDHHIRRSPEKPDIPTKNNPCPAEIPVSHVQHPRHPHPPGTPHPTQPTHHKLEPEYDRSRRGDVPISARVTTDLEPESNRSRRGTEPISAEFGSQA